MELEKHKDALQYQLHLSYRRHRSKLQLRHYTIYFEDVDSQDLAAVANAKVEARANIPEQWPTICDSFEKGS
jgi:ribosomal protein L35AE/L33A